MVDTVDIETKLNNNLTEVSHRKRLVGTSLPPVVIKVVELIQMTKDSSLFSLMVTMFVSSSKNLPVISPTE